MRFRRRETGRDFDPSAVDLVAEAADGVVELVIVRDAPWTGAESELATFQQKVQTYVSSRSTARWASSSLMPSASLGPSSWLRLRRLATQMSAPAASSTR